MICGFARSFGQTVEGTRIEYLKPIMFSGGIGAIGNYFQFSVQQMCTDAESVEKRACTEGMLVAKIGGPAYRIGVGGGAASSVSTQGEFVCRGKNVRGALQAPVRAASTTLQCNVEMHTLATSCIAS